MVHNCVALYLASGPNVPISPAWIIAHSRTQSGRTERIAQPVLPEQRYYYYYVGFFFCFGSWPMCRAQHQRRSACVFVYVHGYVIRIIAGLVLACWFVSHNRTAMSEAGWTEKPVLCCARARVHAQTRFFAAEWITKCSPKAYTHTHQMACTCVCASWAFGTMRKTEVYENIVSNQQRQPAAHQRQWCPNY